MSTTMTGDCSIVTVERQLSAAVRAQVRVSDIAAVQRSSRGTIDAALRSLDMAPLGRSFTLWRPLPDGRLDLEMGVLVPSGFEPVGEVVPSALPAGRTAHLVLAGSYEGLPDAYSTLFAWCTEQRLTLANVSWEIYDAWNDDSAKLRTDIHALLA